MKKFLFALCLLAGTATISTTVSAQQEKLTPAAKENPRAAKFQFKEETHDFGTIAEGPAATYEFTFKNVGKEPLIITNAHASCGCTVPEFNQDPVLPGKTGKIKVTYNTQGRTGPINKTVFIKSNAASDKAEYELYIRGTVTPSSQATPDMKG